MGKRSYLWVFSAVITFLFWGMGEGFGGTLTVNKEGTGSGASAINGDTVDVATFAVNMGDLSFSAEELDFGMLTPGKKATKKLTITNSGTANVDITLSGLEETQCSFSGSSNFTLKPHKKYNLKITCKGPLEQQAVNIADSMEEAPEQLLATDMSGGQEDPLPTPSDLPPTQRGKFLTFSWKTISSENEYFKLLVKWLEEAPKATGLIHMSGTFLDPLTGAMDCLEEGDLPFNFLDIPEVQIGCDGNDFCEGSTTTKCQSNVGDCYYTYTGSATYHLFGNKQPGVNGFNLSVNIQMGGTPWGVFTMCCEGICSSSSTAWGIEEPEIFTIAYENGIQYTFTYTGGEYRYTLILSGSK